MNMPRRVAQSALLTLPLVMSACLNQTGQRGQDGEPGQSVTINHFGDADETTPKTTVSTDRAAATLAFLEGNWSGTLTYLDYQDNTTRVSLPMTATFNGSDQRLSGVYAFTEPNGSIINDASSIELTNNGTKLTLGEDTFDVKTYSSVQPNDAHIILAERDNNGTPHTLTVVHSDDTVEITNRFSNDAGETWTIRNQYVLERTDG
ncbi:MAG: hypothetical protein AB8F26_09460 [Phycisphaerales bacterium]